MGGWRLPTCGLRWVTVCGIKGQILLLAAWLVKIEAKLLTKQSLAGLLQSDESYVFVNEGRVEACTSTIPNPLLRKLHGLLEGIVVYSVREVLNF